MKLTGENKPQIEKHEEVNQQKEFRKAGQLKPPKKGQNLYRFNTKTGDLDAIDYEKEISLTMEGTVKKEGKVYRDPDCVYFSALNEKNAARKLHKAGLIESQKPNE
jgi:hypothetical protein